MKTLIRRRRPLATFHCGEESLTFLFFTLLLKTTLAADLPTPVILLDSQTSPSSQRSLLIDAAVLRYIPKSNSKPSQFSFAKYNSIPEILDAMNKSGAGDEMYRGMHSLSGWPQQTVSLTALEHRPAFHYASLSKPEPIQYSTFGLNLKISAAPPLSGETERLALAWDGQYSWSTNFIPKQIWESLLMGVMTAGQLTGASFTEQDHSESTGLRRDGGQSVGKDLVSLFKRKKGPTEVKAKEGPPKGATPAAPENQSYLDALRQERRLSGLLELQPNQLALVPINPDSGNSLELFYLILRYEFEQ